MISEEIAAVHQGNCWAQDEGAVGCLLPKDGTVSLMNVPSKEEAGCIPAMVDEAPLTPILTLGKFASTH